MLDLQIIELSLGLERGQSLHGQVCPKCGGGKNHDRSFSITKDSSGNLLYMCHRATCGYSGRILAYLESYGTTGTVPVRATTKAPGPRTPLSDSAADRINELYGIKRSTLVYSGVQEYQGQCCIPIYNIGMIGWEYRYLPPYPKGVPKSKSYREKDQPWLNRLISSFRKITVVVEDIWSQLKVDQELADLGASSCSLMGSHMSSEQALDISSLSGNTTTVICLDKDATDKALKLQKKYAFLFHNLVVIPIQKDLKYLNRKELLELFGGLI